MTVRPTILLRAVLVLGVSSLAFAARALAAESPPPFDEAPRAKAGHRGRPLPECRSFWLTEVGTYYLLDQDPIGRGSNMEIACDVGWMRNLSPRNAVGGTVFAEIGGEHLRGGLRARYRRWLGRDASIDVTSGFILKQDETSSAQQELPALTAGVALSLSDVVSIGVEAQRGRYSHYVATGPLSTDVERRGFSETNWRVGGRLGSTPGTIGTVVFILVAALWSSLPESM